MLEENTSNIKSQVPYLHLLGLEDIALEQSTLHSPMVAVSWTSDVENLLKRFEGVKVLQAILSKIDMLVVDTRHYQRKIVNLGFDPNKIFVLPFGIDLDIFEFCPKKNLSTKPMRIYANRKWDVDYGIHILLRALSEIVRKKSFPLEICIAGDGKHKTRMQEEFSELLSSRDVFLPGHLNEDENKRFLRDCDLFISPSPIDGTSVSMLESMAIGTPVITTDIDQNKEWIENEKTGYLFEVGSWESLKNRIELVWQQKNGIRYVSQEARRVIEERANYSSNIKKFQKFVFAQNSRK